MIAAGSFALVRRLLKPHTAKLCFATVLVVVNRALGLMLPASLLALINNVMKPNNLAPLPWIVGGVVLATLAQALTQFALDQMLGRTGQTLITQLRMEVQAHVGKLPVAFFDRSLRGSLAARIMKDVGGLRELLGPGAVEMSGSVVTVLLVFAALLWLSVRLAVPTIAFLLGWVWVLRHVSGALQPLYRLRAEQDTALTGRLTESLSGVRVVKAYAAERAEAATFAAGVEELTESGIAAQTAGARLALLSNGMTVLGIPMVLLLGAHEVARGRLNVGAWASFLALLAYGAAAARQLGGLRAQWAQAFAALERTGNLLREVDEDDDPRRTFAIAAPRDVGVCFRDVAFEYEAGRPVLHGVSFEVEPGTVTALVGSSGAGKSTILSLLCGFASPTAGRIEIGEVDLATVQLGSYRQMLGVALQEPFLFSGTIRENVLFARAAASEEELRTACRVAHVDEFAERLPAGYDTLVGERGVRLSGGQQQRVCLARAILADPGILLLDEATSSLDSESEAYIQEGLAKLMKGRTTIAIAHRLSTIRGANQILVVEEGRIVERGTHEVLLAARGRYFELYTRQAALTGD